MLEDLTAENASTQKAPKGALGRFVKWSARKMLRWEPEGSILVTMPNEHQLRFGAADDPDQAILKLNNYKVIANAIRRGSIGFAESYMDQDVECPDLVKLFNFYLHNYEHFKEAGGRLFKARLGERIAHIAKRNSKRGSKRNISEHYDLGNAFFELWLDEEMVYSSGIFDRGTQSLEDAQKDKIRLILDMLDLKGGEHILEIGCGWGGFARRAAGHHNAKVTGITLSREQLAVARTRAEKAGLDKACTFRLEDYRDVSEKFDHIVSIEMIEAVGEAYWPRYFQTLRDRLKTGGRAVIQAITIDEAEFDTYRRKADFIQKYIFPGGMLPTKSIIKRQAEDAGLQLEAVEQFGESYARTLREWRVRFEAAWPEIAKLGFDERFRRCWRYYLAYCEVGFEKKYTDVGAYKLRKI